MGKMHGTLKGMDFLESMILKHKVCGILYVLNFIFYKIDGSFGIIKVGCVFPMVVIPILYCPMRNSDEMTIGKTHPTLIKQSTSNRTYDMQYNLMTLQ